MYRATLKKQLCPESLFGVDNDFNLSGSADSNHVDLNRDLYQLILKKIQICHLNQYFLSVKTTDKSKLFLFK